MNAKVLLVVAGIAIGAAGGFLYSWLKVAQDTADIPAGYELVQKGELAQAGRVAAAYQMQPAQGAAAVVWRLNASTGRLELCYASNYKNWIAIPGQDLLGRCSAMPMP